MSRSPKPTPGPTYTLPMTVAIVAVVEGEAISAQSLLDIAAVSRPTPRADWTDMLREAARVQRCLGEGRWAELDTAVLVLARQMGLILTRGQLDAVIWEGRDRTEQLEKQDGFTAIAHRLCVFAVM